MPRVTLSPQVMNDIIATRVLAQQTKDVLHDFIVERKEWAEKTDTRVSALESAHGLAKALGAIALSLIGSAWALLTFYFG